MLLYIIDEEAVKNKNIIVNKKLILKVFFVFHWFNP